MRKTQNNIVAAVAFLALVGFPLAAFAANSFKLDASLQPTGSDSDAKGRARFQLRGSADGRFDLKVQRLGRDAVYEVILNGVRVGDLATTGGGSGKLRFRSHPRSTSDVFLGFDPRGASVVLRDDAGSDVLAANVPVGDSGSGSSSDGDVLCCIPDDSGSECEDRTPEACVAQGGTVSAATSCLPNPCDSSTLPGDDDILCCTPDDLGPECEDRTPAECGLQGGIAVEATSCLDNPCAAIAPSDDDVICCLPDNSGVQCEDRTPGQCLAEGGVSLGAGVCAVGSCDGVTPPGGGGGNGNATVVVTCEKRSSRSRASINGNNLATGNYTARLISGANEASAPLAATVGDEVGFDFDSDPGDIAAGATAIAAGFLEGSPAQATGQLIDSGGSVVAAATVTCQMK